MRYRGSSARQVRESDIVARIGGEEFTILLPIGSVKSARLVSENIRMAVANGRIRTDDGSLLGTITISIGISLAKGGETLVQALEPADQAMYRAKEQGRTCVYAGDDDDDHEMR